ncbi:MAG: T9SS type A sorting domain-containing protein [Williamsia sp.]|nr:T9SS type A sorting domain-containing protein [Williamsia sp.]
MKNTYTLGIALLFSLSSAFAQPDVFNPNDPVVNYDPARPPATPPSNTIAKWVRTKVYNWNTDNFKCYYYNGMAFRLRYPTGYNPADKSKKYPVIVFFHGGGEAAPITDNETHLFFTAEKFQNMANDGSYNSFLLYPLQSQPGIWEDWHFQQVNNLLDSLEKYCNTDPDRVLTMGLSMGGFATLRYGAWYNQRSCLAIGSSPALVETLTSDMKDRLLYIPMWMGNGGLDVNPIPLYMQLFDDYITQRGGNLRHSFYPLVGHSTWFTQYDEPYLLPYMQDAHKANPILFFGRSLYDQESSVDARMGISAGFYSYEWQKDGALIASATNGSVQFADYTVVNSTTGNEVKVKKWGSYRVRFKRTYSSNWSEWSPKPVVISSSADRTAPTTPANLKTVFSSRTSIDLAWDASTDNIGVTQYDVYVNGAYKKTTTSTSATIDGLTPHTNYSYAVKALDKAGNASALSNTVTEYSAANGLRYKYYQGIWSLLPDFLGLNPSKQGTSDNIDISLRPSGINSNYAFVWEGWINIRVPGTYTFETASDDGSRFYFNTTYNVLTAPLINNDGIHPLLPVSATVTNLAAGVYPVTITYFQKDGGQNMGLYWSGPGFAKQPVPDLAFSETEEDNIPPTAPANLKSSFTGRTLVDLAWDYSQDNMGVAKYDVYVDKAYKLSTTSNSATVSDLTARASHTFEVKAVDLFGNVSPASSITVTTAANGLKYRYYEGNWDSLPEFNALVPVKTGVSANIDMGVRNQNDYFGFVWEGWINIKTAGTYTFETVSDDGSKLYFNSFYSPSATPLVKNNGVHPALSSKGSVYISAPGFYPIAITYFEKQGTESMQVYWEGPGVSRQLIPNSAFVENLNGTASTGLQSGEARVMADGADNAVRGSTRISAYPNPFTNELKIGFYNSAADNDVSAGIYDLSGKLLYYKHYGKLAPGANTLQLNMQNGFNAGTYVARLQVNGIVIRTWKVIKSKR